MSIPTRQELEELASKLLKDPTPLLDALDESELDENGFRGVRKRMLGTLDCMVAHEQISDDDARAHYATLGFTADEMTEQRQRAGKWE